MGKLFYIIGKSASGKDHIYEALLTDPALKLRELVLFTTRPIRSGETDGKQYHFVDEAYIEKLRKQGRVIEERTYQTVHGPWTYCTADEGLDFDRESYAAIGTLESYQKVRDYCGQDKVVPIYIEVSDENLLLHAMKRESKQAQPKYKEMCRRFLADSEDFSEEKIRAAGITRRFDNNGELSECIDAVKRAAREELADG